MKKRFKKQSNIIKQAVKNTPELAAKEQLCRNVLRLNGIKNPSLEFIQRVIQEQQTEVIKRKYKELTKVNDKDFTECTKL